MFSAPSAVREHRRPKRTKAPTSRKIARWGHLSYGLSNQSSWEIARALATLPHHSAAPALSRPSNRTTIGPFFQHPWPGAPVQVRLLQNSDIAENVSLHGTPKRGIVARIASSPYG